MALTSSSPEWIAQAILRSASFALCLTVTSVTVHAQGAGDAAGAHRPPAYMGRVVTDESAVEGLRPGKVMPVSTATQVSPPADPSEPLFRELPPTDAGTAGNAHAADTPSHPKGERHRAGKGIASSETAEPSGRHQPDGAGGLVRRGGKRGDDGLVATKRAGTQARVRSSTRTDTQAERRADPQRVARRGKAKSGEQAGSKQAGSTAIVQAEGKQASSSSRHAGIARSTLTSRKTGKTGKTGRADQASRTAKTASAEKAAGKTRRRTSSTMAAQSAQSAQTAPHSHGQALARGAAAPEERAAKKAAKATVSPKAARTGASREAGQQAGRASRRGVPATQAGVRAADKRASSVARGPAEARQAARRQKAGKADRSGKTEKTEKAVAPSRPSMPPARRTVVRHAIGAAHGEAVPHLLG